MPRQELLIGAAEFWTRARADIAAARRRVLVQAMTFEGDAVGLQVADTLRASVAPSRRVAVDDYTRWVINDRWVHTRGARRDAALQAEVRATAAMFADLRAAGVEVVWTAPIRRLWRDYPFRNHRKMIVADDVAYIGGINFSEHNFAWPDLMIRMERSEVADRLAADFPARDGASATAWCARLEGLDLYGLDGRTNREAFGALMGRLDGACEEIVVVSPYLSLPFTRSLVRAQRRGVQVRLVTPRTNNKPLMRAFVMGLAGREGMWVSETPGMGHAKAMLIDGRTVVLGSSNFDFVSYEAEAEIMGVFEDAALAEAVRRRVVPAAIAEPAAARGWRAVVAGRLAAGALRLAQAYVRLLSLMRPAG